MTERINRHGIRVLDSGASLCWAEESSEKSISLLARILVLGKTAYKDRILFVHNLDKHGSRRPGFGIPGGRVQDGENILQAVNRKVAEEIPWPIVGEPAFLCTHDLERPSRIERWNIFFGLVDEANPLTTAEQNARFRSACADPYFDRFACCLLKNPRILLDVDYARFFSIEEILKMMEQQQDGAREKSGVIYPSHAEILPVALRAYGEHINNPCRRG